MCGERELRRDQGGPGKAQGPVDAADLVRSTVAGVWAGVLGCTEALDQQRRQLRLPSLAIIGEQLASCCIADATL